MILKQFQMKFKNLHVNFTSTDARIWFGRFGIHHTIYLKRKRISYVRIIEWKYRNWWTKTWTEMKIPNDPPLYGCYQMNFKMIVWFMWDVNQMNLYKHDRMMFRFMKCVVLACKCHLGININITVRVKVLWGNTS